MIPDKLKSYGAACKEVGLGIEHRRHKGLNSRAGNSHLPPRQPERDHHAIQIVAPGPEVSVHSRSSRQSDPPSMQQALSQWLSHHSRPGFFNLDRDRLAQFAAWRRV